MNVCADGTHGSDTADHTTEEPQPMRELRPEPRRGGSALTAEQREELLARFRQRFALGR